MRDELLREKEEVILHLTGMLGQDAYPLRLTEELELQNARSFSIAMVHAILIKLEKKGFVISSRLTGTAQRNGRRKRVYSTTEYGRRTLERHWKLHGVC
jgi:DNA-binding PadR family transcriptional regulator